MTSTRAPFTWDWDAPPPPPPQRPYLSPASASTRWVWLLAFGPYVWGILAGVIDGIWLLQIPRAEMQLPVGVVAFVVSATVALVPLWIFAWRDIRALNALGLRAPSILWMLLLPPLGYFLARRSALRGTGATWLGPQITLAVIVGSQLLSAVVSLLLGGIALLATVATGSGPEFGSSSSDYGNGEFGFGVNTPQENQIGYLQGGGDPYAEQVERLLAAAYGLPDASTVDCSMSGVDVIATSTFPCTVMDSMVSVTISTDGTVGYTELPG